MRALVFSPSSVLLLPAERRLLAAFALAALLAGGGTFLLGGSVRELLTAPAYQPTALDPHRIAISLLQVLAPTDQLPEAATVVPTNERGNWIRIPSLSLAHPLATAKSMETSDVLSALQIGVVRYPNGVDPGAQGVVAVAGHSTGEPWKGRYRFAFMNARKLQAGDVIQVDHDGTRYIYQVTGQRLMNPRTTPFLEGSADRPQLAIITCWPLWTTQQRVVVDADLVSSTPLAYRSASSS